MEAAEYAKMAALEEAMWWYRGLHANLALLAGAAGLGRGRLLDAGCGTGGLLKHLARRFPGLACVGLDVDPGACRTAAAKSGCPAAAGSIDRLPFGAASFDAVVSADVLCHRAVDPDQALGEMARCLKPGGSLILNLPAYDWLASAHDARVHNARRYTAAGIGLMLSAAGLRVVRSTYWNTGLFPLMVVRRRLLSRADSDSDVRLVPKPVEAAFRTVMALEAALIARGVRLPFGGSVLVRAVKE